MFRLIIWIVWLLLLLGLCVVQSRQVLLTPQFGFIASFIPQALFLLLFVDKWSVDFSDETLLVIMSGTALFFAVSALYAEIYKRRHNTGTGQWRTQAALSEPIHVSGVVLLALFALNVLTIVVSLNYIAKLVPGSTYIEKIANLAASGKFSDSEDKIRLPLLLNQVKAFIDASNYVMVYLLAHGIILKYSDNRLLLLLNLGCGFINMFLTGNRGPFVQLFLAAITLVYFLLGEAKNWKFRIRFKTVCGLACSAALLFLAMYFTLSWFGKTTRLPLVGYLGEYLSAPLKNLDTFVREGMIGSHPIPSETFRNIINSFGRLLGKTEWQFNFSLPFRQINGETLGNVHTVFACYLVDFGYPGLVVLVALMAVISQATFLKVVYGRKQRKISILLLTYSYIYQALLLSFFSDRFYYHVFSLNILKYPLSWWLLRLLLTKITPSRIRIVWGREKACLPASRQGLTC